MILKKERKKTSQQIEQKQKGTFLPPIKDIQRKPTANITFSGERLNYFSLRLETRQRYPSFNIVIEGLSSATKHGQEIKQIQIVKKEEKYLYSQMTQLPIQNPKESRKNCQN